MVSKVQSVGCQLLGRKLAALWIGAGFLWLHASESLGWLRCIPLQLVLVAVADEMSEVQMLKLLMSS